VNKQPVKNLNNVLCASCSYCGSTCLEEDEDVVKCFDCGMGKYKKGRHRSFVNNCLNDNMQKNGKFEHV
jgi:hypothetical protein